MRRLPCLLLLPALALAACAPTQSRKGPDYSALSGNYEGNATLGPLPTRYALLLNISGSSGRADGVLTRLSNGNVYSASGTFRPYDAQGGMVDLKLYSGRSSAGTLSARVQSGKLKGTLKTTLFTFNLSLQKVGQPVLPAPVTTAPVSAAPVNTAPTNTAPATPVPASPTPVMPAPGQAVPIEPEPPAVTSGTSLTPPPISPISRPVYVEPTPVKPVHP